MYYSDPLVWELNVYMLRYLDLDFTTNLFIITLTFKINLHDIKYTVEYCSCRKSITLVTIYKFDNLLVH